MNFRSFTPRTADTADRWWIVDADGQILGRLSTRIATKLRGKDQPTFSPHADTGNYVVVVNAEKIQVTGRKVTDKLYYRHSGYPGGLKVTPLKDMLSRNPERVLESAVRGMLPKNALGRKLFRKLRVYAGPDHPHSAQQPKQLPLK